MLNPITIIPNNFTPAIVADRGVIIPPNSFTKYRMFFDFTAAANEVYQSCTIAPTLKIYYRALSDFINYLEDHGILPEEQHMTAYQNRLHAQGLKTTTATAYLTPIRRFCRNLANQSLDFNLLDQLPLNVSVNQHITTLLNLQKSFSRAADKKLPNWDTVNYEGKIFHADGRKAERTATWLSHSQAIALVNSFEHKRDLAGIRDYTLLMVGLNTALRLAEIQRLTLNDFSMHDEDTYKIAVLGKRNNVTPIPCPKQVFDQVRVWINAYNSHLLPNDPRRIKDSDNIWRSLTKSHHIFKSTKRATAAMQVRAIALRIERRSEAWEFAISPHDMRRTAALIALKNGMSMKEIQIMLRHKSIKTTEKYLGDGWREYEKATLSHVNALIA